MAFPQTVGIQQKLLQGLGDDIVKKLQASIPHATGKTAKKIHAVSFPYAVEVLGPHYVFALEYGRGPTRSTKKSNPTLFEAIKEWAFAKGIITDNSRESNSIVYAITKKINEQGTNLYRLGTPSGVITRVLDQINMNSLLKELTILYVEDYSSEVIRELKQLE